MNAKGKNGTRVDATTVRFERVLPGPLQNVWDHLTRPDLIQTWLARVASVELRVGGRVELQMDHGGEIPENIKSKIVNGDKVEPAVYGVVTRYEPPRALAYTWIDKQSAADGLPESEVTFELEPRGEDVCLVLTHRRVDAKFVPQVLAGWHVLLDGLDASARSAPRPDFMARFEEVLGEYAAKSP
jgi:uncharacterized protein YndB with AHSA1/START domain